MNPNRRFVLTVTVWLTLAGLAGAQIQPPPPQVSSWSLDEAVTVSVEGKSLITGDPISGHWTGYGPMFSMAMDPEKHASMHALLNGRIAPENGAYRVSYLFQDREDLSSQPLSGGKLGTVGVATFINEVLLKMDEPVTVLDGKGGTLVLKVTKAIGQPEPRPKHIVMDILLVGDSFKENMRLTVRGKYVKGEPFERTMTGAGGNWELTMAKGAPDGVTRIVAQFNSEGENRYRMNGEVYGGAPGAPMDWIGARTTEEARRWICASVNQSWCRTVKGETRLLF